MNVSRKYNTHIVIKRDDVGRYLSQVEQQILNLLETKIYESKLVDRKVLNRYLVVNTDEPYSEAVLDLILDGEAAKKAKVTMNLANPSRPNDPPSYKVETFNGNEWVGGDRALFSLGDVYNDFDLIYNSNGN